MESLIPSIIPLLFPKPTQLTETSNAEIGQSVRYSQDERPNCSQYYSYPIARHLVFLAKLRAPARTVKIPQYVESRSRSRCYNYQ